MSKNVLLSLTKNVLSQQKPHLTHRKYTHSTVVADLALKKYRENGHGITYFDLLSHKFSTSKKSAQRTLKFFMEKGQLITVGNFKPQQYYPGCIRAEIIQNKMMIRENGRVDPTKYMSLNAPLHNALEYQRSANCFDYMFTFGMNAPIYIHRIQLQTSIDKQYYVELDALTSVNSNEVNKAKMHEELIGNSRVKYVYSPNGKIQIYSTCSHHPFKLEDENDLANLYSYFGQIRDRLINQVSDTHEREIKPISAWTLNGADLNKDVPIDEKLQLTLPKVQLVTAMGVFRSYVKALGNQAVWRVEESVSPRIALQQSIDNILNPNQVVLQNIQEKLNYICTRLESPSIRIPTQGIKYKAL